MDIKTEVIVHDSAIKYLSKYTTIKDKVDLLCSRIAQLGGNVARVSFQRIAAFYNDGVEPEFEVFVDKTGDGYEITAYGESIAFLEFGTGTRYNEGYPLDGTITPPVSTAPKSWSLGPYGKKQLLNKDVWKFKDASGEKHWTGGNPPAKGMYNASKEMRIKIKEIAEEVFKQ